MSYVGIDGCKSGWFFVKIQDGGDYEFRVVERFEDLGSICEHGDKVLVDIPIGLRTHGPEERKCDKEARRVLRLDGDDLKFSRKTKIHLITAIG